MAKWNVVRSCLKALMAPLVAASLAVACASPKPKRQLDTSRLLQDDLMQGWKAIEKAPPVVGKYDEIYYSDEEPGSVGRENCSYAESQDRTIIICERMKKNAGRRPNGARAKNLGDVSI